MCYDLIQADSVIELWVFHVIHVPAVILRCWEKGCGLWKRCDDEFPEQAVNNVMRELMSDKEELIAAKFSLKMKLREMQADSECTKFNFVEGKGLAEWLSVEDVDKERKREN